MMKHQGTTVLLLISLVLAFNSLRIRNPQAEAAVGATKFEAAHKKLQEAIVLFKAAVKDHAKVAGKVEKVATNTTAGVMKLKDSSKAPQDFTDTTDLGHLINTDDKIIFPSPSYFNRLSGCDKGQTRQQPWIPIVAVYNGCSDPAYITPKRLDFNCNKCYYINLTNWNMGGKRQFTSVTPRPKVYGQWDKISSITGINPSFKATITHGVENTISTTYAIEKTNTMSATLSAGFDYMGLSVSNSLSNERSTTVMNSFQQSRTTSRKIEIVIPCADTTHTMAILQQWVLQFEDNVVRTLNTLCYQKQPSCALGHQDLTDMEKCRD